MRAVLNNIESWLCRILLATFVTLLFAQIVSRQVFGHSISWSEELSTYMFVWFAFFGASHAAKVSAHNRVTVQFRLMPPRAAAVVEAFSDLLWVAFNLYFVYLSYVFIFEKMNLFWKSQTLGVPMKYLYLILPVAFALMAFRVLQVNYLRFVLGRPQVDPDAYEARTELEIAQAELAGGLPRSARAANHAE